jgi:hyperosmotically inducible protein
MLGGVFVLAAAAPAAAVSINPITALKDMVETVFEDRNALDVTADFEIKSKIITRIADEMASAVPSLNVDVYERDVMITGIVETEELKERVGRTVASVEEVDKIYNELRVISAPERQKGAIDGYIDDNLLEAKINAVLFEDQDVHVTNFRWRAVDGHIFLFGRALSKSEQTRALKLITEVPGVIRVIDRSKIKPRG